MSASTATLLASTLFAQSLPGGLQPVDAAREDINPLRTSFRLVQPDLRVPSSFERVYRVPGSSAGIHALGPADGRVSAEPDRFARVSGGITAVFPASEYRADDKGRVRSLVPPGTVFYIGGLPAPAAASTLRRVSPLAAADMVRTDATNAVAPGIVRPLVEQSGFAAIGAEPTYSDGDWSGVSNAGATHIRLNPRQPAETAHVLTNERYRQERTRALLTAAAKR